MDSTGRKACGDTRATSCPFMIGRGVVRPRAKLSTECSDASEQRCGRESEEIVEDRRRRRRNATSNNVRSVSGWRGARLSDAPMCADKRCASFQTSPRRVVGPRKRLGGKPRSVASMSQRCRTTDVSHDPICSVVPQMPFKLHVHLPERPTELRKGNNPPPDPLAQGTGKVVPIKSTAWKPKSNATIAMLESQSSLGGRPGGRGCSAAQVASTRWLSHADAISICGVSMPVGLTTDGCRAVSLVQIVPHVPRWRVDTGF